MSNDYVNTNKVSRVIGKQRRRLQFETFVLLTLVTMLGWLGSVGLYHLGFGPIWLRYLICTAFSYGLFLVLYWLWMKHIVRDLSENLTKYDEERGASANKSSGTDWWSGLGDGLGLEEIGLFLGILAIVVAVAFFVFLAPVLLIDLMTSEILLFFVLKRVSSIDEKAVFLSLLKNTWVAFVVLCAVIVLWALTLQAFFPAQDSFSAIIAEFLKQR